MLRLLRVLVVRYLQPSLDLGVDLVERLDADAVRDAVFLLIAAGFDQPALAFARAQREAEIDAGARGGLDLRENVPAIQRHHGLAGAGLHVLSHAHTQREQLVVERP